LRHYPNEIPSTLSYQRQPVQDFLKNAAEESPEKVAIHFMGKEFTYKNVYESAQKLAGYLQEIGIEKDDRVAIM
ncbi:AMP-binding protein, partial [Escherichia coli]|uniref:AMP-binding protein n=1 Tax=Escherichia coli TaxID=562 RepID=UPI0013C37A93